MIQFTIEEFFSGLNDNEDASLKKEIFQLQTVHEVAKLLKFDTRFSIQIESDKELIQVVRHLIKDQEIREEKSLRHSGSFDRKELKSSEDFEGFKHLLFKVEGFKDCFSDEVIKEIFDSRDKHEK